MTAWLQALRRRGAAPDGFILVTVLWILAALAALVSVYTLYLTNTATGFVVYTDRVKAESLIRAGVELAAYEMTARPRRRSGASFDFRMGPNTVQVSARPENALIDLNAASKELLAGLFTALGASPAAALTFADRIVGWRTPAKAESPGMDEESSVYRVAGLNYGPRQAPFAHIYELALVAGIPKVLVERAMPYLTVYSGVPQVNAFSAGPEVIAALPGMTPDRLHAALEQRQNQVRQQNSANQPQSPGSPPQNPGNLSSVYGGAERYLTMDPGKTSRVTVVVQSSGHRMRSEVVILMIDGDSEPYRVLSWRDDIADPLGDEGQVPQ